MLIHTYDKRTFHFIYRLSLQKFIGTKPTLLEVASQKKKIFWIGWRTAVARDIKTAAMLVKTKFWFEFSLTKPYFL